MTRPSDSELLDKSSKSSELLRLTSESGEIGFEDWANWWSAFLRGATLPSVNERPALGVVDLFCGAGGFGLGASLAARSVGRRAHFERIVDADAKALEVYSRNLSVGRSLSVSVSSLVDYQVRRRGGIARFAYPPEIISEEFAIEREPALLIGGPPCQGHSNLNNYTRRADPRNDLLYCSVAIAVAVEAKSIVLENVRSIQLAEGDLLATAIQLLQSEGYEVNIEQPILKAASLGWPQTRERYFLSAVRHDVKSGEFGRPEEREPKNVLWAIGDLAELEGGVPVFDEAPTPTEVNRKRIEWFSRNENKRELPFSERPDCHKDGTTYTAVYGRMYEDRPAPTITTGFGTPGQGRFIHPTRPRVITPHEAARIQGFPDNYRFFLEGEIPKRKDLAKWIGDAVPPILGFAAVSRVLAAMDI